MDEEKTGKHKYTPSKTLGSENKKEYIEFDRDENGIADAYGTSVLGTEKLDLFYLDNDEDGYPDLIVTDMNEDGIINILDIIFLVNIILSG